MLDILHVHILTLEMVILLVASCMIIMLIPIPKPENAAPYTVEDKMLLVFFGSELKEKSFKGIT